MSYVLRLVSDVGCHVSYLRPLMCDMYDIWSETVDIFVRCQMSNVKGLMSYVDVSDDWCQTSVVWCQASDVWGQISDVRRLISDGDVTCLMSYVRHLMWYMYDVWCHVWCVIYVYLMWGVWCLICVMSDVRRLTSWHITDIWYQTSDVLCLMSCVWRLICLVSDVTCLMSRLMCDMYDIWSETSDLLRQMSDIWCQTSDV